VFRSGLQLAKSSNARLLLQPADSAQGPDGEGNGARKMLDAPETADEAFSPATSVLERYGQHAPT
jgi:hypothetical protein